MRKSAILTPWRRVGIVALVVALQATLIGAVMIAVLKAASSGTGLAQQESKSTLVASFFIGAWVVAMNLVVITGWLIAVMRMFALKTELLFAFDIAACTAIPLAAASLVLTPAVLTNGVKGLQESTWGMAAVIAGLVLMAALGLILIVRQLGTHWVRSALIVLVWLGLPLASAIFLG
ncbi:MAG: hypothetical protein M3Y49_04630 [Actinomycetota bacterium]|nr:hypothetical protein [Actinomycetota bacterium]